MKNKLVSHTTARHLDRPRKGDPPEERYKRPKGAADGAPVEVQEAEQVSEEAEIEFIVEEASDSEDITEPQG